MPVHISNTAKLPIAALAINVFGQAEGVRAADQPQSASNRSLKSWLSFCRPEMADWRPGEFLPSIIDEADH